MFGVCQERCAPSFRAQEGVQVESLESWCRSVGIGYERLDSWCVRGVVLWAGPGNVDRWGWGAKGLEIRVWVKPMGGTNANDTNNNA